jgi:DNA-binding transcriptional MerR regulator
MAQHHFYVQSADDVRKQNFSKEYQLRGLSAEEIQALFEVREQDEAALIQTRLAKQMAKLIEGRQS